MTPKDAIIYMKDYLDCGLHSSYVGNVVRPSIELAIEALEKQIPKKPIPDERGYIFRCPNCKAIVVRNLSTEKIDYCIRCGQAIDRTEDNE